MKVPSTAGKIETEIANKTDSIIPADLVTARWKLKFYVVQNYGLACGGFLLCLLLVLRSVIIDTSTSIGE